LVKLDHRLAGCCRRRAGEVWQADSRDGDSTSRDRGISQELPTIDGPRIGRSVKGLIGHNVILYSNSIGSGNADERRLRASSFRCVRWGS
jgi:hypothetical protein